MHFKAILQNNKVYIGTVLARELEEKEKGKLADFAKKLAAVTVSCLKTKWRNLNRKFSARNYTTNGYLQRTRILYRTLSKKSVNLILDFV